MISSPKQTINTIITTHYVRKLIEQNRKYKIAEVIEYRPIDVGGRQLLSGTCRTFTCARIGIYKVYLSM